MWFPLPPPLELPSQPTLAAVLPVSATLEALLLHVHLRQAPHVAPTRASLIRTLATHHLHRLASRPYSGPAWLFKRALEPQLLCMLCSQDAQRSILRCYQLLCGGRKLQSGGAHSPRPNGRSRSPSRPITRPRGGTVGARVILVARFLRESGLLPRVVARAVDARMQEGDQELATMLK